MEIKIANKNWTPRTRMTLFSLVGYLILMTIYMSSCKPKTSDNPQELITTVKLTFSEGSSNKIFQFKDLDGIGGGLDGIADTIRLDTAKNYHLTIEVLDESTSPSTITSDEIRDEGIDHQFFFNVSHGLNISQTYDDVDAKGMPIGLSNYIKTGSTSSGTFRVNLKHQPGIKDGNQLTGESDIDITFQTILK